MASQQQQARPMFRFASMIRPAGAPPPPAAATQPMFRPTVAAPSFKPPAATAPPPPQTRDPTPPPQRPPTAPPPPTTPAPPPPQPAALATRSPPRPAATRTSAGIPVVSSRSPPPSPRNLEKAPNQQYSPQVVKPVSPLKLPPAAQFKSETEIKQRNPPEIDQKTVVVQERAERNNGTAQKFNATQRHTTSSEADWTGKREAMITNGKDNIHHKKRSDTEESLGMSVLTLAGENKGAMMELSPARANKLGFNGNPRRLDESDEEGKSGMGEKNNNNNNPKGMESLPMTAFMNSNVQGLNNSILHNASCTHHDPGVHLIFSRKSGRYTKEPHHLN